MIDEATKGAKLTQLANDRLMILSLRDVFDSVFNKRSPDRDVHNLAARFLAIELSKEVLLEIEKHKIDHEANDKSIGNIGL